MVTIDPRFLDVLRWTAETGRQLAQFGTIPKLSNEDEWPRWANYVIDIPELASVGAPRPENFKSWDDWAVQFNLTIRTVAT